MKSLYLVFKLFFWLLLSIMVGNDRNTPPPTHTQNSRGGEEREKEREREAERGRERTYVRTSVDNQPSIQGCDGWW